MHALEDEPEKKGRWGRRGAGLTVAAALGGGMLIAAQHVEPARRLMPEILQLAVVDEPPPPPKNDAPPPAPPPPPPPKQQPKREQPDEKPVEQAEEQKAEAQPEAEAEPAAGLDSSSFGLGAGTGVTFRAGKTQMGDPNRAAKRSLDPPKVAARPPKLLPARAVNPVLPAYPERARKLNIQGYVLLEAEIDERGTLRNLRVRESLAKELDEAALASVRGWKFRPASLGGRAVPSTRLIRIRFELN